MILRRPRRQVVLCEQRSIDVHLLGQIRHSPLGHLSGVLREPPLDLEKLQQSAESQSRRPRLVGHQLPVLLRQRPVRDQILGFPLTPHQRHNESPVIPCRLRSVTLHLAGASGVPGLRALCQPSGRSRRAVCRCSSESTSFVLVSLWAIHIDSCSATAAGWAGGAAGEVGVAAFVCRLVRTARW